MTMVIVSVVPVGPGKKVMQFPLSCRIKKERCALLSAWFSNNYGRYPYLVYRLVDQCRMNHHHAVVMETTETVAVMAVTTIVVAKEVTVMAMVSETVAMAVDEETAIITLTSQVETRETNHSKLPA